MVNKLICLIAVIDMIFCMPLSSTEEPHLILNALDADALPRHFRTFKDPYKVPLSTPPTRKGLDALRLSGSAQFSQREFSAILKHVSNAGPLYDIDLRQEFHGFLNGLAISWFISRDWINRGKSSREIAEQETKLLQSLLGQKSVVVSIVQLKSSGGGILEAKKLPMEVKTVQDEQAVMQSSGVNYQRLYVTDHMAPEPDEVERFLQVYRSLPSHAWLHIHCAGGDGRTTTFMAMVDMLHNAKDVAFDDILARQYCLGGSDLAHLGDPQDWKTPLAKQRLEFLKAFYDKAKNGNADKQHSQ